MPNRTLLAFCAAAALAGPATALAQPALSSLLPETTVLALHASPEGFDASTLRTLFEDLELERAGDTLGRLAAALGEAADLAGLGEGMPGDAGDPADALGELAAECPDLAGALEEAGADLGPAVVGLALSPFDPIPVAAAAARPGAPDVAARLVAGAVDCFDGEALGSEGEAQLYVLADGSDMPVVVADVGGTVVLATDPEVARGMVRRANGSGEPGFADTRLGRLSSGMTARGLGVSLNLAAAADGLELYRALLSEEPAAAPLFDRLLTTLRVFGGFAWHVTVDAGGVVVESVAAYDASLAEESGEEELMALLTCAGCDLGAPDLLPRDAVRLSGRAFSLGALVDWVDTWLADAREAGLLDTDARQGLSSLLGVDIDEALLGWVGDTWHVATLDVLATDLRPYLQGLPTVVTVPVSDEAAARRGVELWLEALTNLGDVSSALAEGAGADGAFRLDEAVSVQDRTYRGVDYLRVRAGPTLDLGVAVFGGHLVVGSPVASLHAAVDVHLGTAQAAGRAWRTYESLALAAGEVVGYRLTDASAFLRGLAQVSDLAAGSVATGLWLGVQGALLEGAEETSSGAGQAQEDAAPGELPTYDELIALADLVTESLELLAERSGVAVGTTEIRDGVRWTTWRLPLR